jgi:general secretion pathway protein L
VAKLAKLAPFAIEDAIVSAPEEVHCVVFDGQAGESTDAERLVAVIDREWLAAALAALASAGIRPDRAIVESALVADADGAWTVVWSGDGGFAAPGGGEAIALDASVDARPPLALKLAVDERRCRGEPPRAVRVLLAGGADAPDVAKWSEGLHAPVAVTGRWLPEERDAREARCPDLLPSSRHGAAAVGEWLARLKPAAVIAAALIAVHGVLTLGDWVRLAHEARSLRQDMERAFRKAFPDAQSIVDPALQMRRNLADLRRAAGEPDAGDLVPLLARLAPALARANARPRALRYERGELQLDLAVGPDETRERLASRLQVPGVRVRIERVATGGPEPLATVRIAAEGA